jgi:hypothetical protein
MAMPPYLAAAAEVGARAGGDPASLGPAVILLGTTALLLALFVLAVVLLARSHRRGLSDVRRTRPDPQTDAWREAGRRLEPPDEGADV